jgi:hypothetical protein
MRRSLVVTIFVAACSSSEATTPTPAPAPEAGTSTPADSGTPVEEAGADTSTPIDPDAGPGETCIGYGAGESCENEATQKYGYVCFGGAPPGVQGCKLLQASGVGNSYCCSENVCVEQIDQGAACNGVSGKPRRLQCPPTASGNAAPPADCVEHNSGSSEVEKYYCCP